MRAESGGAARPPRSRIPSPRARPRSSCCRGVLRSRVRALTGQINRICQYALRNPTLHDNERELTVECGEIGRRTGDRGARGRGVRGSSRERDGRRETRGSCCVELSSYVGPSRCRRRPRRRAANRRPTPPLPYAKGCRRRPAARRKPTSRRGLRIALAGWEAWEQTAQRSLASTLALPAGRRRRKARLHRGTWPRASAVTSRCSGPRSAS